MSSAECRMWNIESNGVVCSECLRSEVEKTFCFSET